MGAFLAGFLDGYGCKCGWKGSLDAEIQKRGRITIGEMIRVTGASRNTLKEHFKRLQAQGHLIRHGTGKGTWYALP